MQTALRALAVSSFFLAASAAWPAHFVFVVDMSDSMKAHRASTRAKAAVLRDLGRLLHDGDQSFQPGDRVHLWSFSDHVVERLEMRYDTGLVESILDQMASQLNRLKPEGRTSLARPLIKALQTFGTSGANSLSLFLYTDGKDSLTTAEVESVLQLYKERFADRQLSNAFLIRFGNNDLRPETQNLLAELGGQAVPEGAVFELNPVKRMEPAVATAHAEPIAPEPVPEPPKPVTVQVSPPNLALSILPDTESIQAAPIEFTIEPPDRELVIAVALETTALPDGMSMQLLSDRIATKGRQSLSFVIRNAEPGRYTAKVQFAGQGEIHPPEVPLVLEVAPRQPAKIGVQFYSQRSAPVELASGNEWQDVPGLGMFLVYADSADGARIAFDWSGAAQLDLQVLAVPDNGPPIPAGKPVSLSTIGRLARFQIRRTGSEMAGASGIGTIRVSLAEGQNAILSGAYTAPIPFQFAAASEAPPAPRPEEPATNRVTAAPELADRVDPHVDERVIEPSTVTVEIDNPMVAGQPIRIRARSEARSDGGFKAVVEGPGSEQRQEVVLVDNGSTEANDQQPADGVYSGFLEALSGLGRYRITAIGTGSHSGLKSQPVEARIYFQPPNRILSGRVINRGRGEVVEFRVPVTSDLSIEIPVATEPVSADLPMVGLVSNPQLRPGENVLDLIVTLSRSAASGDYLYEVNLAAEVDGLKARIPLRVRVQVLSFFQYFVRLMAVALGLAFAVYLVFFGPWRTFFLRDAKLVRGRDEKIAV